MKIEGLDEIDNRLVNLLRHDARLTYSDLGDQVGLTRVAVKNRVKALEDKGIIRGYHAVIDPLVTPQMKAFVAFVETTPDAFDDVANLMLSQKCVVTLCQTSGGCRLFAVCVAEKIEEMRAFAREIRNANPGVLKFTADNVWDVMKGSVLPE